MATGHGAYCDCDLDLLAHDDRATHAYGCPAHRAWTEDQDHREYVAEKMDEYRSNG